MKSTYFSIKKLRTWKVTKTKDKKIAYYRGTVSHSRYGVSEKSQKSKEPLRPLSPV